MSVGSYRWWGCIALVMILLFGITGCSKYKTFSQTEGFVHFSFEYPYQYQLDKVSIYKSPLGDTADILFKEDPPEEYRGPSIISVFISEV